MFTGKTIAITGAASGIGRALCFALAKEGGVIFALDYNEEALAKLSSELKKTGAEHTTFKVDITDYQGLQTCVDTITVNQKLDYFINNAGIAHSGSIAKMPNEQYSREIQVNLIGTINGTQIAIKKMENQGFGTIINMASIAGHIPAPFLSIYVATKFAVVGFTRALREELHQLNSPIKTVLVSPGFVKSEMTDRNKFPEWLAFLLTTPEKVANEIVKGIKSRKSEIYPSTNGKIMRSLHFLAPTSTVKSSKILLTKSFKDFLFRRFDQPD